MERRTQNELVEYQNEKLREIIKYSYNEVKYYRESFDKIKVKPEDILGLEDLYKLPVINKQEINEHWEDFKPKNLNQIKYINSETGGTSGTPFSYRISKENRFSGIAVLYRGWGLAGYTLSDPMGFFGGSSIGFEIGPKFKKIIAESVINIRKFPTFDMNNKKMADYARKLAAFKPKFLRGYPTSIHVFSQWAVENKVKFPSIQAVFTTGEMLYPSIRENIERNFGVKVFDGYGATDGSISAFECKEHNGYHIDTERGLIEVVGDSNTRIYDTSGKIIATTLLDKAMPLIRYDTGDIGILSSSQCPCKNPHPILRKIEGRSADILVTPSGTKIHGWIFLWFLDSCSDSIKQYQVIQQTPETLLLKIVPNKKYNSAKANEIIKLVHNACPEWKLNIECVNKIPLTKAAKMKYIIGLENR